MILKVMRLKKRINNLKIIIMTIINNKIKKLFGIRRSSFKKFMKIQMKLLIIMTHLIIKHNNLKNKNKNHQKSQIQQKLNPFRKKI